MLWFADVRSLRSLTLGCYTAKSLFDEWNDPDEDDPEEVIEVLHESLPSGGPLSDVNTLHFGPETSLSTIFRNFRASGVCPNARRLSLAISEQVPPSEPEEDESGSDLGSDPEEPPEEPKFFLPLFQKLETLELDFAHSLDVITDHARVTLEQVSLFNAPSGQKIRRVELRGRSKLVQEAASILKQSLPSGVKLEIVETKPPTNKKIHPSWSLDWN